MLTNIIKRSAVTLLTLATLAAGASAKTPVVNTLVSVGSVEQSAKEVGEVVYKLSNSREVVMNLLGTTPIRNWKMTAHGLNGEAKMIMTDNRLLDIQSLTFALPVYNLKGDVSEMDEDAYTALKADRYREIVFKLAAATVTQQNDNSYAIAARGTLTVAGVTRIVTLQMRSRINHDGSITVTGAEKVKMSDYNVERPSLLFGTIKAGDEMTLTYNLIFTK